MRSVPDEQLPFVSVHVPAYNEPPELLKETLDGLAALDYPRFEVLVIDNNTKDPNGLAAGAGVLRAARASASASSMSIRSPATRPGRSTSPCARPTRAAEVVAVIDADYIVQPHWLRHLVPAFADPEVAIVQAPQDYRDADQNAFKAMCMAEYRGFFHLGMVTRNERNAIIQHGTMTMIRRTTLDEVNGWAEWCITEDAELGLRLFEAGYKALYIPCTYGRGLMPDTFADFQQTALPLGLWRGAHPPAPPARAPGAAQDRALRRTALSLRRRLAALVRGRLQPAVQLRGARPGRWPW